MVSLIDITKQLRFVSLIDLCEGGASRDLTREDPLTIAKDFQVNIRTSI